MRSLITALLMALAVSVSAATRISWTPGTPGTDATIAHYELFLNGALVATPGAGTSTYTYSNCAEAGDLWTMRLVDSRGDKSMLSDPPAVQPRDECTAVAVTTPTGLKLAVDNPRITVSWDAVPGAVSYEVYLNGNRMATVKGLQSLRTVQVGKCVTKADFYTVRAVAADGSKSPAATPVSVTATVCNVSCP
jgi:hypothetical protein